VKGLDLERFWRENDGSLGKPFSTHKPRVPVIVSVDDHWVIGEMKVESTVRYYTDAPYRERVHAACNKRTLQKLGRAFFPEHILDSWPKRIEEVFGAEIVLTEGGTPWLESKVAGIEDLVKILRRVEKLCLEEYIFPPDFFKKKKEFEKRLNQHKNSL